ncbi:hypothetical protein HYALB_00013857 [Hymenoscyphus albidus]|uniref:Uncharacterized protein n=1 Tax=Hymenoscyphus albidus TaxID=595503 RepID=A0A9N9LUN5_9HELO|nr:hypothetical protein HYALB_00013410 [Hymenoscyphus albidus]CAG8981197.1 hypothetical protein HYALB_00013857 [Hymenoscyphus albidus]
MLIVATIYYGTVVDISNPGTVGAADAVILFPQIPDCSTHSTGWLYSLWNDINEGGSQGSCDGCTAKKNAYDMPITRLELLDEEKFPITTEALDDIALYQVEKEPERFDIHWKKPDGSHGNGHDKGYCMRTQPRDADV